MLTPKYLAGCSDDIVALYAQLELEVLKDIARRIAGAGVMTASAEWQARMLQESGVLYEDIIKKVSKMNKASEADIRALFEKSSVQSLAFDNEIFKTAGLGAISAVNGQILTAGIEKTLGNVRNMTMTAPRAGQQAFIKASTNAYMQVTSGAFDYNTAIANACKEVAKTGLQVIAYDSGARISLEAGIRRNVMTGVNQTTQQITNYNCDLLGVDLVETSAHGGARPEHMLWQGKIFSRSGTSKKYSDFVSSTGYETAAGLGGVNCRHSYYPYIEGDKTAHTKEALEEMERETVTYQGRTITRYEGEQKQREIERKLRGWKRESAMLKASGVDSSFADKKIKEWNNAAKDFTSQTGIPRQRARENVFTGGARGGIIKDNNKLKSITPITDSAIEKVQKIDVVGQTPRQNEYIQQQHKELLRVARDENNSNEVAFIFSKDFSQKSINFGMEDRLEFSSRKAVDMLSTYNDLFIMHNHPRNGSFSLDDIVTFLGNDRIKSLSIVKNNGFAEVLTKSNGYDKVEMIKDLNRSIKNNVKQGTNFEYDKAIAKLLNKFNEKGIIEWMK